MRVMAIVKADQASESGALPSEELLRDMGKFNDELLKAGVMLAGEGLHPTSKGKRVRFEGSKRTVIDGPFTETKELIGGFWLLKVKSMDEAVEWVKKVPFKEGEIEIRRVFEEEDFGDLVERVPEVFEAERKARQKEEALREEKQRQSAR